MPHSTATTVGRDEGHKPREDMAQGTVGRDEGHKPLHGEPAWIWTKWLRTLLFTLSHPHTPRDKRKHVFVFVGGDVHVQG